MRWTSSLPFRRMRFNPLNAGRYLRLAASLPTFPSPQVVYRIDLHYTQLWPSAPDRLTPCVFIFRTGSRDLPRTSRTLGVWKYSSHAHGEGREEGTPTDTEAETERKRDRRDVLGISDLRRFHTHAAKRPQHPDPVISCQLKVKLPPTVLCTAEI